MKAESTKTYLEENYPTLGKLLSKLQQLNRWNGWLRDALSHEPLLTLHCCIVGLEGHSLIVIADNAHWATRLRFFIPDLVTQLKKQDDLKNILAICCKVRPAQHQSIKKPNTTPHGGISTDTAKIFEETANKIQHDKLKNALKNLAKQAKFLPPPK